jgi:hypothetical protein
MNPTNAISMRSTMRDAIGEECGQATTTFTHGNTSAKRIRKGVEAARHPPNEVFSQLKYPGRVPDTRMHRIPEESHRQIWSVPGLLKLPENAGFPAHASRVNKRSESCSSARAASY